MPASPGVRSCTGYAGRVAVVGRRPSAVCAPSIRSPARAVRRNLVPSASRCLRASFHASAVEREPGVELRSDGSCRSQCRGVGEGRCGTSPGVTELKLAGNPSRGELGRESRRPHDAARTWSPIVASLPSGPVPISHRTRSRLVRRRRGSHSPPSPPTECRSRPRTRSLRCRESGRSGRRRCGRRARSYATGPSRVP